MNIIRQKVETSNLKATTHLARPGMDFKRLFGSWGPVLLLTLGILWLIEGASAHMRDHNVIIQGNNYNAGMIETGKAVSHEFRLLNLSTLPVEVDTQPSCGCTVVDVPSQIISPLHSGVVKVNINTQGIHPGLQQRAVLVQMVSGQKIWQQKAIIRFRVF
jgi:hypothetical protein